MKKIVYIAHPISGDIEGNLADLRRILRIINMNTHPFNSQYAMYETKEYDFSGIIPLAPYYADIVSLDDNNTLERKRGIENDIALLEFGVFQEVWLTGSVISFGMREEVKLAVKLGIPVVNYIGKI